MSEAEHAWDVCPITGKKKAYNLLNRTKVSKHELDQYFNVSPSPTQFVEGEDDE